MKQYEKIVIAGDFHIPDEEVNTIKIFKKFLKDEKPDTLVLNGDILDFYDLSTFDKELIKEGMLQEELDRGVNLLKELRRTLPKARIVMTTSNHMEERLERFKRKMGRAVSSLRYLSIEEMLQLKKYDVEVTDCVNFDTFIVYHGNIVRKHSAYTGRAVLEDKGISCFVNHVHRLGSHYKSDETGIKVAVECGCMCKLDPEYIKGKPNWQQGFAMVIQDKKTKWFQHYLIPIVKDKFIWKDKIYE